MTYRELLVASLLVSDILLVDVDEEISVPRTDAAITVHDCGRGVRERRRDGHGVLEAVAVAGGSVGLAGLRWCGCCWGFGGGHDG